jgi:SAM-dependent methyltransferase
VTPTHASFRDPEGRLFRYGDRILRALNSSGEASLRHVLNSSRFQALFTKGSIVGTRFLPPAEAGPVTGAPEVAPVLQDMSAPTLVEHEPAPFASYPQEWAPEMLHAGAMLTIQLARTGLAEGIGIKDATPSNVMFWGPRPVFLDVLSFEQRDPHDPTWLPYAQFARTFLLPLAVNLRFKIPLGQIFTTRRDGLEPEEVYPLLGAAERLRPPFFSLVSMPVWLAKRSQKDQGIYQPRQLKNAEQARFILDSLLRRQERLLKRLRPPAAVDSKWSGYMDMEGNNYSAGQQGAKQDFVRNALAETRPASVLDVGCNTGAFSLLAAEQGARVVAVDYDPVVIGRVWRAAKEKKADILPLVVNLAQPTPALGWANRECRSFLDRASGAFDMVFMLALIHHLLVTDRIPLPEIFETARRMTKRWVILEFIAPDDSMFQRLTRGRAHLHQDLNREVFEAAARRYFRIVRTEWLPGSKRHIYLLEAAS